MGTQQGKISTIHKNTTYVIRQDLDKQGKTTRSHEASNGRQQLGDVVAAASATLGTLQTGLLDILALESDFFNSSPRKITPVWWS